MAVAVAAAAAGVSALSALLLAGLAVQISSDLDLGVATTGYLIAAGFATRAIGAIALGRMADRAGWRRVLTLASTVSAGSLLALAALGRGPLSLAVATVIGAFADSAIIPATNLLVHDRVPSRLHATVMGYKQSAVPIMGILVGFAVPTLGLRFGWRWVFVTAATIPAFIAVATYWQPEPKPRATAPPRTKGSRRKAGHLFRIGFMARVGSSAATAYAIVALVAGGATEGRAAMYFLAANVVGLALRLLSGRFTIMSHGDAHRPIAAMLLAGAVGCALIGYGPSHLLPLGMVLAVGFGWGWAGLFHYAILATDETRIGATTGGAVLRLATGAAAGPFLMGLAYGESLTIVAWTLAGGCFVIAAGMSWLMWFKNSRRVV